MAKIVHLTIFVLWLALGAPAFAEDCDKALKFNREYFEHSEVQDLRMVKSLQEDQWKTLQKEFGVDAEVYGIPLSLNWSQAQNVASSIKEYQSMKLSSSQATAVWKEYFGETAKDAYVACLQANASSSAGLHLDTISVDSENVYLLLSNIPVSGPVKKYDLDWDYDRKYSLNLPNMSDQFFKVIRITRLDSEFTVAVTFKGAFVKPVAVPIPAKVKKLKPPMGDCKAFDEGGTCLVCFSRVHSYFWTSTAEHGTGSLQIGCPFMKAGLKTFHLKAHADLTFPSSTINISYQGVNPDGNFVESRPQYQGQRAGPTRYPIVPFEWKANANDPNSKWTFNLHDCSGDQGPSSTCVVDATWVITSDVVDQDPWDDILILH
jgi:hypothetical protein